jgi:hypothetical protein
MRDRRAECNERKDIQKGCRSTREPGQESNNSEGGKSKKKPWCKFWDYLARFYWCLSSSNA